jgi:type IV secretory pathway VirB10-like protein
LETAPELRQVIVTFAQMTESYVDLTYRGLQLARRVKLTSVRPREGYVEMPAPMPVGTEIQITTDDGVAIPARVTGVTEQTAGASGAPGMQISPVLEGANATWWAERVALPEAPAKAERTIVKTTPPPIASKPNVPSKPVTAPMRAMTPADADVTAVGGPPQPSNQRPYSDESSPVIIITPPEDADDDGGGRTRVMDAAVAEVMREQTAGESQPSMAKIVDDGQRTTVMEAVDLSALGLTDPVAPASADTGAGVPEAVDDKGEEFQSKPTATGTGTVKRRRKKKPAT